MVCVLPSLRFGGRSLGTFLGCNASSLPESSWIWLRMRSTFLLARSISERFFSISSRMSSGVMDEMRLCVCFFLTYSPLCCTVLPRSALLTTCPSPGASCAREAPQAPRTGTPRKKERIVNGRKGKKDGGCLIRMLLL